jgi:hypothetical protein
MRLEATPGGAETSAGLAQVQSQLANLTIQLQDMAKAKVMCMNMCGALHVIQKGIDEMSARSFQIMWRQAHQVHFHLDSQNGVKYVDSGAMCHPASPPYRSIKQQITPPSVNFVSSVGHDISSCRSLQMMQDNT